MMTHPLMSAARMATCAACICLLWPITCSAQYVIEKPQAPLIHIPDTIVSLKADVSHITTKEGWRAEVAVQGMCIPDFAENIAMQTFFTLHVPPGGGTGFNSGVDIDAAAEGKALETLLADATLAADTVFILRVTKGKLKFRTGTPSEASGINRPPHGRAEVAFTRAEAEKMKAALAEAVKLHAWLQPRVEAFNKAGKK